MLKYSLIDLEVKAAGNGKYLLELSSNEVLLNRGIAYNVNGKYTFDGIKFDNFYQANIAAQKAEKLLRHMDMDEDVRDLVLDRKQVILP